MYDIQYLCKLFFPLILSMVKITGPGRVLDRLINSISLCLRVSGLV